MQPTYAEVKAGWDRAAATAPNEAIHPQGQQGINEYKESGRTDARELLGLLVHYTNLDRDEILRSMIIDYGCGNGRVTVPLAKEVAHICAVDFSYSMLQQLPRDTNITPVLSVDNWFGLSHPADYAFSISVFIHNSYASGVQMMKSISDNLKPGGIALLQIPIYGKATTGKHWSDVTTWTWPQFIDACNKTGFNPIDCGINRGQFSHDNIGPNHHFLQVLKKV